MTARNRGVTRASNPEPLQKKGLEKDPPTAALVYSTIAGIWCRSLYGSA